MTGLFTAVFVASLIGSMHCAGMCGAFVAFAVGSGNPSLKRRWRLNAAYQFGRLVTYALLGAICGGVGAVVDFGGSLVGLQRGATILAGLFIVIFGLVGLARAMGYKIAATRLPKFLQNAVNGAMKLAMCLPPLQRALTIGLLTTLLPCGWLWAFAAVAAGTADPLYGALTMAVFWAGTVPILAGLGAGVASLTGILKPRLAMIMSIAIVVVGLFTIFNRLEMPAMAQQPPVQTQGAVNSPIDLIPDTPPCCPPDAE